MASSRDEHIGAGSSGWKDGGRMQHHEKHLKTEIIYQDRCRSLVQYSEAAVSCLRRLNHDLEQRFVRLKQNLLCLTECLRLIVLQSTDKNQTNPLLSNLEPSHCRTAANTIRLRLFGF